MKACERVSRETLSGRVAYWILIGVALVADVLQCTFEGHGLGEEIPLSVAAVHRLQLDELVLGLNPFCHDIEFE
jgi:hypothetical protein